MRKKQTLDEILRELLPERVVASVDEFQIVSIETIVEVEEEDPDQLVVFEATDGVIKYEIRGTISLRRLTAVLAAGSSLVYLLTNEEVFDKLVRLFEYFQ